MLMSWHCITLAELVLSCLVLSCLTPYVYLWVIEINDFPIFLVKCALIHKRVLLLNVGINFFRNVCLFPEINCFFSQIFMVVFMVFMVVRCVNLMRTLIYDNEKA